MSVALSSTTAAESSRLTRPVATAQSDANDVASDEIQSLPTCPRPGIVRYYTSLQDHADAVYGESSSTHGGDTPTTPRAEGRREGFTWDIREDAAEPPIPPSRPATPPSMEEIMRATAKEQESRGRAASVVSPDSYLAPNLTRRVSSGWSSHNNIARSDTSRSSITEITRSFKRHIPDMRLFLPMEKQHEDDEVSIRNSHRAIKARRHHRSDSTQGSVEKNPLEEEASKSPLARPQKSTLPVSTDKATLKDRRKAAQGASMKLTLPTNIPDLPSRGRTPVAELNSLTASRPRSPKTPWAREHAPSWYTTGPATAPATILEDYDTDNLGLLPGHDTITSSQTPTVTTPKDYSRKYRSIPRLRSGIKKSGEARSDSPVRSQSTDEAFPATKPLGKPTQTQMERAQHEEQVHLAETRDELKEVGKRSRNRRLRWSGAWSSMDASDPPETPSPGGRGSFRITRMFKSRRSNPQDQPSGPDTPPAEKALRRRKHLADLEKIADMPAPPVFTPPGTNRVPTPPMLDANGEVKGKLADFFFNIDGRTPHRPPKQPHGIWDSDAVLMPQQADLSRSSTASNQSPQDSSTPPDAHDHAHIVSVTTPNEPYFNVRTPIPNTAVLGPDEWFRRHDSSAPKHSSFFALRAAHEKAKLEWLTPEHLPTSPLCPLHAKYVGPSKGVCVFHGRTNSGTAAVKSATPRKESAGSRRSGTMDGPGEKYGWVEAWSFRSGRRRQRVSSSAGSPGKRGA